MAQAAFVSWPGIVGVRSLTGAISHGLTPARFQLTTYPQVAMPQQFGDLSFWDGVSNSGAPAVQFQTVIANPSGTGAITTGTVLGSGITLKNCIVDDITGSADGEGQTWTLEILDRRWQWADLGSVRRHANQLDYRGKLIPWTIMSVRELAVELLDAMGETNYLIDLPDGLDQIAGANLDRWLRLGENFPISSANPEVNFDHSSPAVVLIRMIEEYGRRLVYQPIQDRVIIARLGDGNPLPTLPSMVIAPGLAQKAIPVSVNIAGAPVRIQARLLMGEPVGMEWNTAYLPVNDLSYAPFGTPSTGKVTGSASSTGSAPFPDLFVIINYIDPFSGQPEQFLTNNTNSSDSTLVKLQDLQAQIQSTPPLDQLFDVAVTSSGSTNTITITAANPGYSFDLTMYTSGTGPNPWTTRILDNGNPAGADWSFCYPPAFAAVNATDRLSYQEAVNLAKDTVYRCYRLQNINPGDGTKGIILPWYNDTYGRIKRRQQIILQDKMAEQVLPLPRLLGGNPKGVPPGNNNLFFGFIPEYYNGYSRDRLARAYGSVLATLENVTWDQAALQANGSLNTLETDQIFVGFSVDSVEQLVKFDTPIYQWSTSGPTLRYLFPRVILETACLVTDDVTNQVVRWEQTLTLGGPAPPKWAIRDPEVQVSVLGRYQAVKTIHGNQSSDLFFIPNYKFAEGDLDDANARGNYYLAGMAAEYQLKASMNVTYPGLIPIDPDGYVQQVSWDINASGTITRAGGNTEFSPNQPAYPTRRRRENFPPEKSAALINKQERELFPRPAPGAIPVL